MSNWTHINCCVRGEFNEKKLEELFGKPILDYNSPDKFVYGSKKYINQSKKVNESYKQSKLPSGEEPLHYRLIKSKHYHNKKNRYECFDVDGDVLIIWGDLRWFEMSDKKQYKQIEDIVKNILKEFPFSVRQLTMQAYEEYSGKTYIWSSVFNENPTSIVLNHENKVVEDEQS